MPTGVELANAWVRLVPTFEGVTGAVADAFAPAQTAVAAQGESAAKKFSAKLKTGLKIGGAAAAAGVVAGFAGLYKIGETFDDVADTIRVGTGATGKDLAKLTGIAKSVGKSVPADFSAIGTTVADLNTRLGLNGKQLEKVSKQYLEAGRILGEDVDVKKSTAAFSAFGLKNKEISGGMDTLFRVSQATGVSFNDLSAIVGKAAPTMKNLGFSFEETASFAGTLDKAGLNSQGILQSLGKGMVTLAKDGEEPQKAFKRVTGEIQGFIDKGDKAGALELASKIFGTKGATQFVGALQSGKISMDDLVKSTGATSDTILKAGKDTADFAETAKIMGNQAQVALEPLATAVFSAMGDALTLVMPHLQAFGKWAQEHTGVLKVFAGVVAGVVVLALGTYAVSAIAAAAATWTLVAPILVAAAPFIAIGLAIGLLIAAVILLVKNWGTVVDFLKSVWANVVAWFKGTLDNIGKWWNSVWSSIASFFTGVWNGIKAAFNLAMMFVVNTMRSQIMGAQLVWNAVWTAISTFFSNIWKGIKLAISTAFSWVTGIFRDTMAGAKKLWSDAWNGIKTMVKGVWDWINTKVFDPFKAGIKSIGQGFENGAKAIGKAWDKIKGAAARPINFVLDTVWNNGIRSFWNGVVGKLGMKDLMLPEAKTVKFATGGVLPGYTPGRDVHEFYSPSGGRLSLSGGEAIMRPEFTRAVGGAAGVARLNKMAIKGQAFKSGGVFDGLRGMAGDVWDNIQSASRVAGEFLTNPGQAIQSHVIDGIIKPLLNKGGDSVFLKMAGSLPVALMKRLGKSFAANVPANGKGTKGMGWQKMWNMVHTAFPNMVMTSNYRSPGANAAVGGAKGSYHTQGRAIDLIPASMDTFNKIAAMFPNASELIYSPAGMRQLRNGQPFAGWSAAVRAQHYNHVHLAMKDGGVFPGLARGGTITGAGSTIVGENGPELLHLPKGAQVNPEYDDIEDMAGVTFNNYAPLGQSPAQALTEFSNRAKGL